MRIWDGDASSGSGFYGPTLTTSAPITFMHTMGDIVIYNYDWFAYDNDPGQYSIIRLSTAAAPEPASAALALGGGVLLILAGRRTRRARGVPPKVA